MLYSIIPPILLVMSVIGIIIFFVKKAPEAERLGLLEMERDSGLEGSGRVNGGVGIPEVKNQKPGAVKQFLLAILEGIIGMVRSLLMNGEKAVTSMMGRVKAERGERPDMKNRAENDILEKFGNSTNSIFRKLLNNSLQIQALSTLRDALLPKLMKGEVRASGYNS